MNYDSDVIGFSFNGKHSIEDFKIYRTSNGNRFDDNLISPLSERVVDIPGMNG
jgi:hypothetical protein